MKKYFLISLFAFPLFISAQKPAAKNEILKGFDYFKVGNFEEAIKHYDLAVKADDQYGDAYYYRGSALWKAGQLDKALADFNKAISLVSTDPDYYGERGNV